MPQSNINISTYMNHPLFKLDKNISGSNQNTLKNQKDGKNQKDKITLNYKQNNLISNAIGSLDPNAYLQSINSNYNKKSQPTNSSYPLLGTSLLKNHASNFDLSALFSHALLITTSLEPPVLSAQPHNKATDSTDSTLKFSSPGCSKYASTGPYPDHIQESRPKESHGNDSDRTVDLLSQLKSPAQLKLYLRIMDSYTEELSVFQGHSSLYCNIQNQNVKVTPSPSNNLGYEDFQNYTAHSQLNQSKIMLLRPTRSDNPTFRQDYWLVEEINNSTVRRTKMPLYHPRGACLHAKGRLLTAVEKRCVTLYEIVDNEDNKLIHYPQQIKNKQFGKSPNLSATQLYLRDFDSTSISSKHLFFVACKPLTLKHKEYLLLFFNEKRLDVTNFICIVFEVVQECQDDPLMQRPQTEDQTDNFNLTSATSSRPAHLRLVKERVQLCDTRVEDPLIIIKSYPVFNVDFTDHGSQDTSQLQDSNAAANHRGLQEKIKLSSHRSHSQSYLLVAGGLNSSQQPISTAIQVDLRILTDNFLQCSQDSIRQIPIVEQKKGAKLSERYSADRATTNSMGLNFPSFSLFSSSPPSLSSPILSGSTFCHNEFLYTVCSPSSHTSHPFLSRVIQMSLVYTNHVLLEELRVHEEVFMAQRGKVSIGQSCMKVSSLIEGQHNEGGSPSSIRQQILDDVPSQLIYFGEEAVKLVRQPGQQWYEMAVADSRLGVQRLGVGSLVKLFKKQ